MKPHGLAVELDLARVRLVEAREDVREGRLPGAVLAEERVNLAGGRLEVHRVVRDHPRKELRDPAHANSGRGAGIAGASRCWNGGGGLLPQRVSWAAERGRGSL